MRIDYSEPKKSYISATNPARQRKESSGVPVAGILVTVFLSFAVGFGSGWFLSQKATKRSFQAATEQKSLENNIQDSVALSKQPPAVAMPVAPANPLASAATAAQGQPSIAPVPQAGTPTAETSFSFYKNLPSGQKSSVLGSGVNVKEKDDKVKQPLQAAIPSNLAQPEPDAQQPVKTVVQPVAPRPVQSVKNADSSGFTVQVASFPLKSEAEQSRSKLAAKGYNVYVVESNLGNKGVWYRVQIGKKMEQSAAKELASKLGKSALVVSDH